MLAGWLAAAAAAAAAPVSKGGLKDGIASSRG